MPRCVMCKTTFYAQTWDSPAEGCDCNQCISAERARDLNSDEWAAAKALGDAVRNGTLCEKCLEDDRTVPGIHRENHGLVLCESCDDTANESAHERMLSDYYGGSGPQSIREQMDAAYQVKRAAKA